MLPFSVIYLILWRGICPWSLGQISLEIGYPAYNSERWNPIALHMEYIC
jgi:hypothetical protein